MTSATDFLLGVPNGRGVSARTILEADDAWLEERHDWVQWAFPSRKASAFNRDAPVWTLEEARCLPPEAIATLKQLLARYAAFLSRSSDWRYRFDHNHARITRVLLCLLDAGLRDEAVAFHRMVDAAPEPGTLSRAHWDLAMREGSDAFVEEPE